MLAANHSWYRTILFKPQKKSRIEIFDSQATKIFPHDPILFSSWNFGINGLVTSPSLRGFSISCPFGKIREVIKENVLVNFKISHLYFWHTSYMKSHGWTFCSVDTLVLFIVKRITELNHSNNLTQQSVGFFVRKLRPSPHSKSQIRVWSPHLLRSPSLENGPLAAVHRAHRPRLHVSPNIVLEKVRKVHSAVKLQKSPGDLTSPGLGKTLHKFNGSRQPTTTIPCNPVHLFPHCWR